MLFGQIDPIKAFIRLQPVARLMIHPLPIYACAAHQAVEELESFGVVGALGQLRHLQHLFQHA